ncbi:organic hydroperoxide resistance protein [Solicola sp. PLA-1-18]|uniref:organic hydroperoxide resistance protein n=1 Tax=Solicola sp. PLA-1-18 TaxID=3380532 RepID=UPI003B77A4CF
MTTTPEKIIYTARASATGGRGGHATSDDGVLDVDLAAPKEMGGAGGATNPEQLFAAGYAACFQGALGVLARTKGYDTSGSLVTAEVGIGPSNGSYGLAVKLIVQIPDVDQATAQEIADAAHEVCPYSNATRGNIPVEIEARPL